MSQRNFEKLNDKGSQLIAESNRITDITDSKWGHPDGADFWYIDSALNIETATLYNPEVSDEEKLKLGKKRQQAYYDQWWSTEHTCDIEKYEVPGCEEEPDTPVEVWVVKPKNIKPRKNRVLYYVVGGALVSLNPNAYPIERLCEEHKCIGTDPLLDESYYAIVPIARGLEVGNTDKDVNVTSLLTTSDEAYSKAAGYNLTTYDKEDGDTDGPFALGVDITQDEYPDWSFSGDMYCHICFEQDRKKERKY